jgi:hypothetical protein
VKHNKQQGSGQRQQNNNGQCRRSSSGFGLQSREDMNTSGFGRGTGVCRAQSTERFQAESVVTTEKASKESSLQLLKEQAKRMTKALEEIQARIKIAEQQ